MQKYSTCLQRTSDIGKALLRTYLFTAALTRYTINGAQNGDWTSGISMSRRVNDVRPRISVKVQNMTRFSPWLKHKITTIWGYPLYKLTLKLCHRICENLTGYSGCGWAIRPSGTLQVYYTPLQCRHLDLLQGLKFMSTHWKWRDSHRIGTKITKKNVFWGWKAMWIRELLPLITSTEHGMAARAVWARCCSISQVSASYDTIRYTYCMRPIADG